MRSKVAILLCFLFCACFILGACTPQSADPVDTTEQPSTEQSTPAPDEPTTEQETEPPVTVVVPDGELPNITSLLAGESDVIDMSADMCGKTVSQLKAQGGLVFVRGDLFAKSADGLTTANSNWDSVGFSEPVSTDTYTACAEFTVAPNDRGGHLNAALVGLYCKSPENLFVDGGLWFSFRDNAVAIYVKQGFEMILATGLPFSAQDGIVFCAKGNNQGASIYANDVLIATVEIGEQLVVKNADGKQVAACGYDHVSVNGTGYFRFMSHYAFSTLRSMTLQGETRREYAPKDHVYAFMAEQPYAFLDKAQMLTELPTAVYADLVYADALVLGEMFGFDCTADGETLTMTCEGVTLNFKARQTGIEVNGQSYAFPTAVYTKDTFMLPVAAFGQMLGYASQTKEDLTVLALEDKTQEALTMAQERYDLYKNVIYNYDDVECDQTGIGVFEATPYEDRLVGVAYTTWHGASRGWGESTWDLPLCGPYMSDDEKVLRYHAQLLRDAGVDFVFIDWSNNTNYDPVTMRDQRDDFRIIEEATDKLFDVWKTVEGAPKICIFVGPGHTGQESVDNGNHQKKVDQVWRDYVTNPDRKDMYFYYDGKPLLVCYGATPTLYGANPANKWDDDRYTVRWVTGYVGQQSNLYRSKTLQSKLYWSWEERGAQTYTVFNGQVEAVTVCASTRQQSEPGDSGYIPAAGRENGATFKRQFQRACDLGARLVIIVSWNEWVKGEQPSPEISKDIEPSQIHGTFYYDLMREQIKKFKGQIPKEQ